MSGSLSTSETLESDRQSRHLVILLFEGARKTILGTDKKLFWFFQDGNEARYKNSSNLLFGDIVRHHK